MNFRHSASAFGYNFTSLSVPQMVCATLWSRVWCLVSMLLIKVSEIVDITHSAYFNAVTAYLWTYFQYLHA